MHRGVPTEEVLGEMRNSQKPVQYLVGTPKRLRPLLRSRLRKQSDPYRNLNDGICCDAISYRQMR